MIAAKPHPSDNAGRTMACGEPSPSEGSQCRWTARIRIRIRASQKYGMATPSTAIPVATRSIQLWGRTPATIPRGAPTSTATAIAAMVRLSVSGNCVAISYVTGSPLIKDWPRLPCNRWPR